MKDEIFKLLFDDKDGTVAEYKNTDDVVMTLSDWVTGSMQKGNQEPLSILFSVVVHTLAREASGMFEAQFIDHIRKVTSKYREHYKEAKMQMQPGAVIEIKKGTFKS